jgi:hypothetical protein
MRPLFHSITLFFFVSSASTALACGGAFDISCNIGHAIEKGVHDAGHAAEKAVEDAGHAVGDAAGLTAADLTPVREYLRAKDIPPPEAGAYGLIVLQSLPTSANAKKLAIVCQSFIAHFPRNDTALVPIKDRMVTIWPLNNPDDEKAKNDDCDFVLKTYDLNAAEAAVKDARVQHAVLDGEGPYLVGWSPSNTRGQPDKVVLVIDMSADNSPELIDQKFLFWKNTIVKNPGLWRNGWSVESLRVAVKTFVDQYGDAIVKSINLISPKG